MMKSQGLASLPNGTTTSITAGASRARARSRAGRRVSGEVTRNAAAPNDSVNLTKSGLYSCEPISRPWKPQVTNLRAS